MENTIKAMEYIKLANKNKKVKSKVIYAMHKEAPIYYIKNNKIKEVQFMNENVKEHDTFWTIKIRTIEGIQKAGIEIIDVDAYISLLKEGFNYFGIFLDYNDYGKT